MMSAGESTPTVSSWLLFNPNQYAQHVTTPLMGNSHRAAVVERLRELAPYAGLLALPGGSLMALLLWLYRRQKRASFLPRTAGSERRW